MPEDTQEGSLLDRLPTDRLREAGVTLLKTAADKAIGAALEQVEGMADRLSDVADNGGVGLKAAIGGGTAAAKGENPIMGALKGGMSAVADKVKGALGLGSSGGGSGKFKFMNIVEELDVGVPVRVAYDQWTLFADFPSFMKKVHTVEQTSDEKTDWYAQVWWSKRTWQATILEQVPDTHIVWRSTGAKGYVNGIVSFHELAPNLTRVLLVLEYYPVGLFEKTANIWRAVGRRARLEFKHYRRHVMVHTLLEREELEGWRGEIRDSEVVKTHEEAVEEEEARAAEEDAAPDEARDGEPGDGSGDEYEEYAEDDDLDDVDDLDDDPDDEDYADGVEDEYDELDEDEDGHEPDEIDDGPGATDDLDDLGEPDPDEGRRAGSGSRRARAGARG